MLRNKSVGAQGTYLGGGTNLCDTADKELAKDGVKSEKGRQHEQDDYVSLSNLKYSDSRGLKKMKK